ncbi:ABC transporter permease [Nonomuraea sp. NEAU-A123]|uniref:ABC transporter permease n=1 Tax=Nonomuraea sp. NEAU-A123 TaxID=2839649 RepID=UPI001BE4C0BA|nr:ABC transporter permease [Nonomuraea sp. NEAU-A123]MBT2234210.1 ABC transporter permease [Nonomuraea sp. NEAU-A123]
MDDTSPTRDTTTPRPPRGRLQRHRLPAALVAGALMTLALVLTAVLAPLLPLPDPDTGSLAQRLLPPGSAGHLLGTDGQGRDLLSRLVWGTQPSLVVGFLPVMVAGIIGTVLGIVAGLGGRGLENAVMRSLDVLFAFPAVLLAISIAASLGAGLTSLIIALSVILVPAVARVVVTEVARLRELDFMQAAQASGATWPTIALRHVLPGIVPPVTVYCSALVGLSIVLGAGLSFLGLGVAPPRAEWGAMLDDVRQHIFVAPLLTLIPAVAIFLASVAFNVLGEGLRRHFDVRSRYTV